MRINVYFSRSRSGPKPGSINAFARDENALKCLQGHFIITR